MKWFDADRVHQVRGDGSEAGHRVDSHVMDKRGFRRVCRGYEGPLHPTRRGEHHHRQQPAHWTDVASKSEFADEDRVTHVCHYLARREQNARRDREVVCWSLFPKVAWREGDGDFAVRRPVQAAVANGAPDAFTGFLHGGVGEANHNRGR